MTEPTVPTIVGKAFLAAGKMAYAELQRRRLEEAQKVIVRRLAKGQYWAITDDQAAAALFTYLRAAEEGAARRNLELIAEVLANAAIEPDFDPNEFRRHARHLAELSRAEAIALGVMMKAQELAPTPENPWLPVVEHALGRTGYFNDADQFTGAVSGLVRTGWIMPVSLYSMTGYRGTPELTRVRRLVDVEAVVRRAEAEGVES